MSAASLAERVKVRREQLQLSMQGLADATQGAVSKATVNGIENGTTPNPGLDKLRALSVALGWSLDELDGKPASAVRELELKEIQPDPANPRTIDPTSPEDASLVASIKAIGLQQALSVRWLALEQQWQVVDGHRRYNALVVIHGPRSTARVPVLVKEAEAESDVRLMQLVANMQRADMNPADVAGAIHALVEGGMDTQAIGDAVGRKRRWVQEQASVGKHLTDNGKLALRAGEISISQAVALAAERNEERQDKLTARAMQEKLNEDDLRAIIAAAKADDAKFEAEQRAAEQPSLIEASPAAAAGYAKANADGHFNGEPTRRFEWKYKRGDFFVELFQFGQYKWAAGGGNSWRVSSVGGGGFRGGASRRDAVETADHLAFYQYALRHYPDMVRRAAGWPEDAPAMRDLHEWIGQRLTQLGAGWQLIQDWLNNGLAPQRPSKTPATPKPAKAPALLTLKDVQKIPAWAKPLSLAYFVVLDGKKSILVKGWKDMATTMFKMYEHEDAPVLRTLLERKDWANDTADRPFDFGGIVYRITDKKCR